jgi:predicted GIY-YIG superfamily endonuclease
MRRERTIKKLSHEQKNKIIDSRKQPKSAAINKRKSQESSPA